MDLLLVTGFLGAGKTTLLKRLVDLWKDRPLALVVNEFGREGVDGALLTGLGASLREVTGGSVFCVCRCEQFDAALHQIVHEGPERIVVEASGLSDPTNVRAVLRHYPYIDYKGCIALCDAPRVEKTLAAVRVSQKQLAVSDLILLNKADLVSPQEAERLRGLLQKRFPRARVEPAVMAAFDPEWLSFPETQALDSDQVPEPRDLTLQKALVRLKEGMPKKELEKFVKLVYEDAWRVKGIVRLKEGAFLLDCVGPSLSLGEAEEGKAGLDVVFLAGEGMPLRRSLLSAREWYPRYVEDIRFG